MEREPSVRPRPRLPRSPAALLAIGFLSTIIGGTVLLSLGAAAEGPEGIGLLDALFTATSAVCVTGLTVVDTGGAFSRFGEIVILCLIQIGGLGIMTVSTFFVTLLGGRVSFLGREVLRESITQAPVADFLRLLRTVVLFTLAAELAGALVLARSMAPDHPAGVAFYVGLFHSVSAFCNAGFALYPDSLAAFRANGWVNGTVMVLIVAGGLGFLSLGEVGGRVLSLARREAPPRSSSRP